MDWLASIRNAKKSGLIQHNFKKVHYAFEDGKEMVEEYNLDTGVLTRRAWKVKTGLSGDDEWDIEVGEPEPIALKKGSELIMENSNQPFITRRVTRKNLEWRIRNLPYPPETYSVTAEPDNNCITVRTTNKKYFKRIKIPDLERVHLLPRQDLISFSHKFNTLIINYQKPEEVLQLDKSVYEEVKKVKARNDGEMPDCKPS